MIAYLRGRVITIQPSTKKDSFLILEVNGVGYQIWSAAQVLSKLRVGEEAELYVYHSVREDDEELFGLASFEDWEFFKLLLTVSGIGPRSALSILATASREQIRQAVLQNQPDLLHKMCGLGLKTAEKVVAGLKDKLGAENLGGSVGYSDDYAQALDGLLALGYNLFDARKALEKISTDKPAVMIREALKTLSQK
jgi:Holliday junction DNA helicase RuvA